MPLSMIHVTLGKEMLGISVASWTRPINTACLIGLVVFFAALFGILTRQVEFLASLWPANAILLGLMVREPLLRKKLNWFAALVGYVAADIATGGALLKILLITACNFAGVITGYQLFLRLAKDHLRLLDPSSIFYLVMISGAAACASGFVGAIVDPILFDGSPLAGWDIWFIAELVSYVIILPVVLTAPTIRKDFIERRLHVGRRTYEARLIHCAPGGAFILSCGLGVLIGGPGAIMFPIPALLWCALSYKLFTTTLVTLCFSAWTLVAISKGFLDLSIGEPTSIHDLQSIRVGVLLLALTPLTLAVINAARNELLRSLQYIASHDQLSGLLNRRAFNELSGDLLRRLEKRQDSVGVLMLDIDHFKKINDTWGHAGGDQVLVTFAKIVKGCLRDGDVLGRIGGEEFALVIAANSLDDVRIIAERIRRRFAEEVIAVGAADSVRATVSIGGVFALKGISLEQLLLQADTALYRAKRLGRDRIEVEVLGDSLQGSQTSAR